MLYFCRIDFRCSQKLLSYSTVDILSSSAVPLRHVLASLSLSALRSLSLHLLIQGSESFFSSLVLPLLYLSPFLLLLESSKKSALIV